MNLAIIPQATNSAGSVAFGELNLSRDQYYIYNTITETATVRFEANYRDFTIREERNEFAYDFSYDKFGHVVAEDIEGVVKLGSLYNTASNAFDFTNAGDIARRMAIYRLNNAAQEAGADYIVEPIVSMNISKDGKHVIVYTATATAKLVKIKKIDD